MTDPLDYWQRREKQSDRVYGLSGPNGVSDPQRGTKRQVPPRATVAPRSMRRQGGRGPMNEERRDETAGAVGRGQPERSEARREEELRRAEQRDAEEDAGRRDEGADDGGEVNDLDADIAVERDTIETLDPENPPA